MASPITPDRTDIVLAPTPASRIRITAIGALLRIDAGMIRDDERPLAPDVRALAAELLAYADGLEAAGQDVPA